MLLVLPHFSFISGDHVLFSMRLFTVIVLQNKDSLKSSDTPDVTDLTQLLALLMQHLPEDHQKEYQLALQMMETVQAFKSIHKDRSAT